MENLNRRGFIKGLGITTAGFTAGGCLPAMASCADNAVANNVQSDKKSPTANDVLAELIRATSRFQYQLRGAFDREAYFCMTASEDSRPLFLEKNMLGQTVFDAFKNNYPKANLVFRPEESEQSIREDLAELGFDNVGEMLSEWHKKSNPHWMELGRTYLMAHQAKTIGIVCLSVTVPSKINLNDYVFDFWVGQEIRPLQSVVESVKREYQKEQQARLQMEEMYQKALKMKEQGLL